MQLRKLLKNIPPAVLQRWWYRRRFDTQPVQLLVLNQTFADRLEALANCYSTLRRRLRRRLPGEAKYALGIRIVQLKDRAEIILGWNDPIAVSPLGLQAVSLLAQLETWQRLDQTEIRPHLGPVGELWYNWILLHYLDLHEICEDLGNLRLCSALEAISGPGS